MEVVPAMQTLLNPAVADAGHRSLETPGCCDAVADGAKELKEQQDAPTWNGKSMLNAVKMMEKITAAAGWHAQLPRDEP